MEEQSPEEQLNDPESEGEKQIIRGDDLPIVDLKNYNTEGKEAHYVQINQIIGVVTEGKKATEETNKKPVTDFMLDLKSLIANITVHLQAFSERFAEIRTRNLGNRDACTEFIPL